MVVIVIVVVVVVEDIVVMVVITIVVLIVPREDSEWVPRTYFLETGCRPRKFNVKLLTVVVKKFFSYLL